MATLTVTIAAGANAGYVLRKLGQRLQEAAAGIPDTVPTGASTTLVIDNSPATGVVSAQITGGPYTSSLFIV
jgi:hypothetical protein